MDMDHRADRIEAGQGPLTLLLHSSVSGARQWRRLMADLQDRHHLIALNLHGYGATPAWPAERPQTLADQAALVQPFLPAEGDRVSLVGHSFGASVAMKVASLWPDRVHRLILIEPNPFYLLAQHDRHAAWQDIIALRDAIEVSGETGKWTNAARAFADYWTGPGSWEAMPEDRKTKFTIALRPNFYEWNAVLTEGTPLAEWGKTLPPDTTILSAADTCVQSAKSAP